jgi:hypothetical protein
VHKFWLILAVILLMGCRPPTPGIVTGTVTLNGQPIDGGSAMIRMEPINGEGQANEAAIVGSKYVLKTAPGEKKVLLYWRKFYDQTPPLQMFPPKYNDLTEVRYTVTEGKQTKDFAIVAP